MAGFYSLDASALIDSWRKLYPIANFPGLWDRLDGLIADDRLKCIEQVYDELGRGDDDLFVWMKQRKDKLVYPIDDDIQPLIKQVVAIPNFFNANGERGADPWVVALAMLKGGAVVCHEIPAKSGSNRIKVPDVCRKLNLPCIQIVHIVRQENWVFG